MNLLTLFVKKLTLTFKTHLVFLCAWSEIQDQERDLSGSNQVVNKCAA